MIINKDSITYKLEVQGKIIKQVMLIMYQKISITKKRTKDEYWDKHKALRIAGALNNIIFTENLN